MARSILVLGAPATGKTHGMRTLDPKTTFVINTSGKDLPFIGWTQKYGRDKGAENKPNIFHPPIDTDPRNAWAKIVDVIQGVGMTRPEVKDIIVDDLQYMMSFEFFDIDTEPGYQKFTLLANHMMAVLRSGRGLRNDLNIYFLCHIEKEEQNMKLIGKLVREKGEPEGLFTIILMTSPEIDSVAERITAYRLRTQSNGVDPGRSPEGMFPHFIENDFAKVSARLREYYDEGVTLEESKVFSS